MSQRRVTIMGGGHGARTTAADLTLAGHQITLFEFEKFHENIAAILEGGQISITGKARQGVAKIHCLTHDLAQAMAEPEIVLIVVPALYHQVYAEALAPLLRRAESALSAVLAHVAGSAGADAAETRPPADRAAAAAVDRQTATRALADLRRLIDDSDPVGAGACLEVLRQSPNGAALGGQLRELQAQVSRFDFDAAAGTIDAIAARLEDDDA